MNTNFFCGICQKKEAKNNILKDTFTDLDNLKSHYFCDKCVELFDAEYLKTSFYFYKKEKRKIKQQEISDILFNNINFPCKISFTKSRKKHRLFRTKTSFNKKNIIVSTDDGDILINKDVDLLLFNFLYILYNEYKITKAELLTGNFSIKSIQKIGFKKFDEYKIKTKKILKTKKLEFIIDIINKYEI